MGHGIARKYVTEDGKLRVVKTQDVEAAMSAVKLLRETTKTTGGLAGGRHVGSVPVNLAYQWMQECGAGIGTAEWNKYASAKLRSGEYDAFKVHG